MKKRKWNYRATYVALFTALFFTVARADTISDNQTAIKEARELTKRADALFEQGKYYDARHFAERALALQEKTFGPDRPETAAALNTLGMIVRYSGDYFRAKELLERALIIREHTLGANHVDTAKSLSNLGSAYHLLGNYNRAESLYAQSLSIRKAIFRDDDLDTATTMCSLGALEFIGDYERAEQYLKRALAIENKLFGLRNRYSARDSSILASLYAVMGDYSQAESLLQSALSTQVLLLGTEHPETIRTMVSLGKLYYYARFLSRAEQHLKSALTLYEKALGGHPDTAEALMMLGLVYTRSNEAFRAEPLFLQALSIVNRVFGTDSQRTAQILNNLAELYSSRGAYAQAAQLFERTVEIKMRTVGDLTPSTAATLNDFAILKTIAGDMNRAEVMFRSALQIRETKLTPGHPDTVTTLNSLGMLKWAQGNPADALSFLRRAQSIQTNNNSRLFVLGSEMRKKEYLQSLESTTFKHVSFSLVNNTLDGINLGLDSILQFKGRVLDAMSESASSIRQSIRAEDRALLDDRLRLASQLSTLTYQAQGASASGEYLNRVRNLRAQQEALDTELASRSNTFRQAITPVTIESLRRTIPANAALIEWFRYQPFDPKTDNPYNVINGKKARFVAYVVRRDAEPMEFDIGDAQEIESMVQAFRSTISDSKSERASAIASSLFQMLVKPYSTRLPKTKHLLVSPDGALNLIPFGALIDDHGKYLAERFEISYLTSGRDLLRIDSKSAPLSESIVMADPVFGSSRQVASKSELALQSERSVDLDRGGLIFRPLTSSSLEAQNLGQLLKLNDTQVFLREAATESRLKQLHAPEILHIATHGFFLSNQELSSELQKNGTPENEIRLNENPLLRSGIALSGANARQSGASDDGILTALEAAQLDLQGTHLVVLSACDSGMGDVQNGEGVYGLRRALVLAGAETQVTSLWKVSDEATRKLMVNYYQRLLNGEGRSGALRSAQLDMIASVEYSHPYYWASFIPVGNWTPLPTKH